MEKAVVLLAHGSRVAQAVEKFREVVGKLRERFPFRLQEAFMVRANPNLQEALLSLYREGYQEIAIFPVFLFEGLHLVHDIPEEIDQLKAQYPDLKITVLKPLGEKEQFIEFLAAVLANEL
ncbi:cbiX protein [Carboxydothermus islandicus]|uniref:CbiX protein n=1 Tax=Carboxydothermus islandicus TaxID=661089 RepID=A0A1L8D5M9_9THEO|nr:CbiX/SirB N-terminal domain-containing protein [Carboxydothermus islandicus]GAV26424.1 cbiX protein [Carboxydothermus islandicus]